MDSSILLVRASMQKSNAVYQNPDPSQRQSVHSKPDGWGHMTFQRHDRCLDIHPSNPRAVLIEFAGGRCEYEPGSPLELREYSVLR